MNQRGFTLIEVMIVVVVIAILAAIAYPSYTDYISRSRRTDAKSALTTAAQAMEKFYTERMSYNGAVLGTIAPTSSPDGFYDISFDSAPASGTPCSGTALTNTDANAFRLCATPTGRQASDGCGIFSLSNTGARSPTTDRCWN